MQKKIHLTLLFLAAFSLLGMHAACTAGTQKRQNPATTGSVRVAVVTTGIQTAAAIATATVEIFKGDQWIATASTVGARGKEGVLFKHLEAGEDYRAHVTARVTARSISLLQYPLGRKPGWQSVQSCKDNWVSDSEIRIGWLSDCYLIFSYRFPTTSKTKSFSFSRPNFSSRL